MNWFIRITILLTCLGSAMTASALETSLNLGLGPSIFRPTTPDGTWWQEPYAHSFGTVGVGFKAGIGFALTPEWTIDLNYVSLGHVTASTRFVPDEHYDPIAHKCLKYCETTNALHAVDTMRGGELLVKRYFTWGEFRPFIQLGAGALRHSVHATCEVGNGDWFAGTMPIIVGGAGACYGWVCAEASYYHGFLAEGFPIARNAILPMLSVRIPF